VQNTYLGFNNSGSTNAQGVPNNYAYLVNANSYPLWFGSSGGSAQLTSTGLNSTVIGATTPAAGSFTTLSATDDITQTKNHGIKTNTSDASDDGYFYVTGGGALSNIRGAYAVFSGNERSGLKGRLTLAAGYAGDAESYIELLTGDSVQTVKVATGAVAVTGTLSASGTITTTKDGILFYRAAGGSILDNYFDVANAPGRYLLGVVGTSAGGICAGSSAGDTVLTDVNNTGVTIGVNQTKVGRFSAGAFAVTGTLSATDLISNSMATGSGGVTPVAKFTNTSANGYANLRLVGNARGGIVDFYDGTTASSSILGVNGYIQFYTDGNGSTGTARLTVKTAGVDVVGLLDLSAATAGQIQFPATQNASSNANTLDDYEEGTWTPTQGSGLTVVGAFSSAGKYTKIGRQVYVSGQVAGATTISAAASSEICGSLPFAASTANPEFYIGSATNSAYSLSSTCMAYNTSVYATEAITATPKIWFSATYTV
jgi:hypothetical protein